MNFMELSGPLAALTGWLATYALHSTILLGLAALLALRLRDDGWRETLWRTALLGALLTTTVQAAIGYTPVVGRWTLGDTAEQSASAIASQTPARIVEPEASSAPIVSEEPTSHTTPIETREGVTPAGDAVSSPPTERVLERDGALVPIRLVQLLLGAWALVAAVLLGRLVIRQIRLFRILRDRRPIRRGPLAGMLAELRRNAGVWMPVRLSTSPVCPTPVALGWFEICVPERFVFDLSPDQQRSALAHELAHLRRRDPAWSLSAGIIEALFFFQPLNRLARLRLRDAAENLCDDWAVRQTGSPLSLARCLTDIASWVGTGPEPLPTGTMAMAEGGSPLLQRVQRLVEHGADPRPSRFRMVGAAALLLLTATTAPAISLTASQGADEGLGAANVVKNPPETGGARSTDTSDPPIHHAPVVQDSVLATLTSRDGNTQLVLTKEHIVFLFTERGARRIIESTRAQTPEQDRGIWMDRMVESSVSGGVKGMRMTFELTDIREARYAEAALTLYMASRPMNTPESDRRGKFVYEDVAAEETRVFIEEFNRAKAGTDPIQSRNPPP